MVLSLALLGVFQQRKTDLDCTQEVPAATWCGMVLSDLGNQNLMVWPKASIRSNTSRSMVFNETEWRNCRDDRYIEIQTQEVTSCCSLGIGVRNRSPSWKCRIRVHPAKMWFDSTKWQG